MNLKKDDLVTEDKILDTKGQGNAKESLFYVNVCYKEINFLIALDEPNLKPRNQSRSTNILKQKKA